MDQVQEKRNLTQLPIVGISSEVFGNVVALRKRMILALAIPVLVKVMILALFLSGEVPNTAFCDWLRSAVDALLFSFAAVACHRLILLGPDSIPIWGVFGTHMREWRYIFRCVVMMLAILLVLLIFEIFLLPVLSIDKSIKYSSYTFWQQMVQFVVAAPVYFVFLMAFSHLSLILPATAIDRQLRYIETFGMAKGNRMRLAFLIGAIPFSCGSLISETQYLLFGTKQILLKVLLEWIAFPFEIAILSICYKHLTDANVVSTTSSS